MPNLTENTETQLHADNRGNITVVETVTVYRNGLSIGPPQTIKTFIPRNNRAMLENMSQEVKDLADQLWKPAYEGRYKDLERQIHDAEFGEGDYNKQQFRKLSLADKVRNLWA